LVSLKIPTIQIQGKTLGNGNTNDLLLSENLEKESNRKSNKMFSGRQQSKDVKFSEILGTNSVPNFRVLLMAW
jgi:hypothetical protein